MKSTIPLSENTIIILSRGGLFPHTHRLKVPMANTQSPSEDLTLNTSEEYSLCFKHYHQVTISKNQLLDIKDGKEVVVFDNDKKRHSFAVKLK